MGLLKKYKEYQKNRQIKKIAKNLKLVKNAKAIREDRLAALDFFSHLDDTENAVSSLLQRFEYSLEHGINDTREKETSVEGILRHGDKALPHIVTHIKNTSRIAWPLKVLEKLTNERQFIDILLDTLDFGDISLNHDIVDKNYDILCYLRDFSLDEPKKLLHFTEAHDERVRFAAIEALISQNRDDLSHDLEGWLSDHSPENTRIRQAVAQAFVTRKWILKDPGKLTNLGLMEGMYINQKNQLETRA